jgi:hypothetical protein
MFIPEITATYSEPNVSPAACPEPCPDPCPDPCCCGGSSSGGITGPTGPTGPTGATGPQGAPGTASETGATGPTGATGEQGAEGARGATGARGEDGLPGLPGERGVTGATGARGATGPAGSAGATGAAGSGGISDILSVYNIAGGLLWFNRGSVLVPFPDTSINTSYASNDQHSVFTIPEDGIYKIAYDIYTAKQVNIDTTILRDGQPLSGTGNSYTINDYHYSGSIITPLERGDIISLRISDPNDSNMELGVNIGAKLEMMKVADTSILRNSATPRNMNLNICVCY